MYIHWLMRQAARIEPESVVNPPPQHRWPIKDARARFSDLVDRALTEGPQVVTRNGRKAVVVVSAEEWERRNRRRGDLVDFFANSPLREEGVEIERVADHPREIDL
jgi:prevent-host-death family protein